MQRRLNTSLEPVRLRVVAPPAQPRPSTSPAPASRGSRAVGWLRRLWVWIEQPEAEVPPSRPKAINFYSQL